MNKEGAVQGKGGNKTGGTAGTPSKSAAYLCAQPLAAEYLCAQPCRQGGESAQWAESVWLFHREVLSLVPSTHVSSQSANILFWLLGTHTFILNILFSVNQSVLFLFFSPPTPHTNIKY